MKRQPPVHSPLTLGAVLGSCAESVVGPAAALDGLARALGKRFAAPGVVLTDSGTHALQIALARALPRGAKPPMVAMPGYCCYDLVTAAVGADVRLSFYDVDPRTLSPDLDSLRAVVSEGASAVVVANLYGYPLDWSGIAEVAADGGLPVIEDAAQGIGAAAPGGPGGTLGDLSVLSFGRGKGWTGGGGGALLVRRPRGNEPEAWAAAGTRGLLEAEGREESRAAGLAAACAAGMQGRRVVGRPRHGCPMDARSPVALPRADVDPRARPRGDTLSSAG